MTTLITAAKLQRLNRNLAAERAALFATVLGGIEDDAQLTTPRRVRHFLAQVAQETGGLRSLIESTRYSDAARLDKLFLNVQGVGHAQRLIAQGPEAIGNTIYANKNGNGSIASGDGFRFRGRGFLQITGRGNYRSVGKTVGMKLEEQPESVGEPSTAASTATAYWRARKINLAADANDVGMVTELVNGRARLHLKERAAWLKVATAIWPD